MAPPKLTKAQQEIADSGVRDELVKRAKKAGEDPPSKATKAELAILIEAAEKAGETETAADLEATSEAAAEAAEARHDGDVEAVGDDSQDPDATTKAQPPAETDPVKIAQAREEAEDDDQDDEDDADEAPASTDLEDQSKADLQRLASDLGVEGRSTMTKPELVEAIRLRQRASRSVEAAEELADRVAHPPRTEGNNPEADLHDRVVDRDDTTRESGAVVTADGVAAAVAVVEQSPTVDTMPDAQRPGDDEDTARVRNRRRRDDQVADSKPVTFVYVGGKPALLEPEPREVTVPNPSPTYDRLDASREWELAD